MSKRVVKFGPAVLLLAVLCACSDNPGEGNAFRPTPAFAENMKLKAQALAAAELEKFNKADRVYMNEVVFDRQPSNEATTGGGVFYKRYREFHNAEVVDIRQSSSYFKPIVMDIRYDYRIVGTQPHHSDFPDSQAKAAGDKEYKVLRERRVTRSYPCDWSGTYDQSLPEVLPPDNFYFPPEGSS